MHGGSRLCTVFSVLRQLSHRKAALTLPLRAGSQQLSVKYGDFIRVAFKRNYVRRKTSGYYFFFLILGGLFQRKAALTFLLRADLQQWSVNYGDSYVGISNENPFAFTSTSITSVDVYK